MKSSNIEGKSSDGLLGDIACAIGEVPALVLVSRMGGARIYCNASNVLDDSPVVLAIGKEGTQKLFNYFAGECIDLPTKHVYRAKRDDMVIELNKDNTVNAIALKLGISRRQVYNILAKARDARLKSDRSDTSRV
jgi:hypothetical protein